MAFLDETGATILADEVKTYVGNTAVAKETGKGLSTNDYTTAEKNKLAGIAEGANRTTVDTALSSTSANSVQNKVIKSALDGKSNINHTHNYAGSSSAGGAANSAVKLDTATAGSATQPVYFSGGKPVACSYTLGKSVPSNAVFTDTNTWRGIQNNLTSDSTTDSLSAAQGKVLKGLVDGKAASDHTHNYDSIYLKYKTTKVAYSSTVEVWRAPDPNSQGRLVLFTAHTNSSYHNNTVWFYNKKLHTPNFSSSVGYDATLNNFTVTNYHGIFIVKYHNTDNDAATVKCYDFMG